MLHARILLVAVALVSGCDRVTRTVTYPDGAVFEVREFCGPALDGRWQQWFADGHTQFARTYEDGEPAGTWRSYYEDGRPWRTETYVDHRRHGVWTEWYANGSKSAEGTFARGDRTGTWRYWNDGGDCVREEVWDGGSRVSVSYPTR